VTWNNWHKLEVKEAEEERVLERLEALTSRDTQDRMARPSTQRHTAIIGDHLDATMRQDAALQRRLRDCSNGMSTFDSRRNYILYTKAAVPSTRGVVELGVKIDGSSVNNLLPQSIASRLRLLLHFGKNIQIGVAYHIIPAN
jgi:phage-related baseplate assembly protein